MSCQQVPRLPEDPYTFTEPPATAKYFSSQSHKLQSLNNRLSTAQLSHSSFDGTAAAAAAADNKNNRSQQPTKRQNNSSNPTTTTTHTNGAVLLPKRNGPIYGKTRQLQQKQRQLLQQPTKQQQQPQSGVSLATPATPSSTSPPSPTPPPIVHVFNLPPAVPASTTAGGRSSATSSGTAMHSSSTSNLQSYSVAASSTAVHPKATATSQQKSDFNTNPTSATKTTITSMNGRRSEHINITTNKQHTTPLLLSTQTATSASYASSTHSSSSYSYSSSALTSVAAAAAAVVTKPSTQPPVTCIADAAAAVTAAAAATAAANLQKPATSPLAAQLPPTPPSSSPIYSPLYSTNTSSELCFTGHTPPSSSSSLSSADLHSNAVASAATGFIMSPLPTSNAAKAGKLQSSSSSSSKTIITTTISSSSSVVGIGGSGVSVKFARPAPTMSTASSLSLSGSSTAAAALASSPSMKQNTSKPMTTNAKRTAPATKTTTEAAKDTQTSGGSNGDTNATCTPASSKLSRSKRSYSQSSHHEALQRIPQAASIVTANASTALPPYTAIPTASIIMAPTEQPANQEPARRPATNTIAANVAVSFIRSAQRRHRAVEWHAPGTDLLDIPSARCRLTDEHQTLSDDDETAVASSGGGAQLVCFSPPPPPLHIQRCWFHPQATAKNPDTIPTSASAINRREQRLNARLQQLQGQARQMRLAQSVRTVEASRQRMAAVEQTLRAKARLVAAEAAANAASRCAETTCQRTALLLATHCLAHITLDVRQRLFVACTAKFADNTQCSQPAVFDVGHKMPLCREHAWKRDNYTRIVQEQKQPKKTAAAARKTKSKTIATPRPAAVRRPRATTGSNTSKKMKQSSVDTKTTSSLYRKATTTASAAALFAGPSSSSSSQSKMDQQHHQPQHHRHHLALSEILPATANDTSNSSSTQQSLHLANRSPPNMLNHFTISSNDSFVSSNDASQFANSLGVAGITESHHNFGMSDPGDYGIGLSAVSFDGSSIGGGTSMSMSGAASTATTPSVGDAPMYFQSGQFQQHQQQPFQQPQNMYTYGQQYQQQHHQQQQHPFMQLPNNSLQSSSTSTSSFLPRYPSANQFFGQNLQLNDAESTTSERPSAATPTLTSVIATSSVPQQQLYQHQQQHQPRLPVFTMSENSSAYESSEDTGIGGGCLSESEHHHMSSSVASSALVSSSGGNIDFGSNGSRVIGVAANCADGDDGVHGEMDDADVILVDHDLNNVLSQLNTHGFEDIFTEHQQLAYKPTQEEDQLIDQALEAADSQAISLHHMARDFFSDILDVDEEILENAEMMDVVEDDSSTAAPSIDPTTPLTMTNRNNTIDTEVTPGVSAATSPVMTIAAMAASTACTNVQHASASSPTTSTTSMLRQSIVSGDKTTTGMDIARGGTAVVRT